MTPRPRCTAAPTTGAGTTCTSRGCPTSTAAPTGEVYNNISISTAYYLQYLLRYGDPEAGLKYAEDLEKVILAAEASGRRIGAFLYEPMLVIPGVHTPPPGYYQHVFRLAVS